jgi:hypothetical protein
MTSSSLAQMSFSYRITLTFSYKIRGRIKGKIVPLLSYELCHEDVCGSRRINPLILNLGTRRR